MILSEKASSSTSSGKSGLGKVIITLVGGGVVATAGTLAYAKIDPSFRKQVEQTLPVSSQLFDATIGPGEKSPVVSLEKKVEPTPSLLSKKLEREAQKEPSKTSSSSSKTSTSTPTKSSLAPVPPPPLEKPASLEKSVSKQNEETKNSEKAKEASPPASDVSASKTSKAKTSKSTSTPSASPAQATATTTPVAAPTTGLNERSSASPGSRVSQGQGTTQTGIDYKLGDLSDLPIELQNRIRAELTEQLKIQFSAYNDYLHEQLALQEQEIRRLHQMAMEERIVEERMSQQRNLADSIARLQEVERVLSGKLLIIN